MSRNLDFLQILPESWNHANAYYLKLGEGWIVDPGLKKPEGFQDPVAHVLATHGHYDHLAGIDSWLGDSGQFYIHTAEADMLKDPEANASKLFAHSRSFPDPDLLLQDGHRIDLDEKHVIETWHTPGHTEGSSCFLLLKKEDEQEEALLMFSGDCFFADSVGRSDLPGGDPKVMRASIDMLRIRLLDLPEDMPVLAGHGRAETVQNVLAKNPFFREGGFFGF